MSKDIKLKPCPFCGGKAIIEKSNVEYPNYFARCTTCRVQTMWYADKEKLVAAWNNRIEQKTDDIQEKPTCEASLD